MGANQTNTHKRSSFTNIGKRGLGAVQRVSNKTLEANEESAFFQNPSFQTLSDNIHKTNSNARETINHTSRNPSAYHYRTNSNVGASGLHSQQPSQYVFANAANESKKIQEIIRESKGDEDSAPIQEQIYGFHKSEQGKIIPQSISKPTKNNKRHKKLNDKHNAIDKALPQDFSF